MRVITLVVFFISLIFSAVLFRMEKPLPSSPSGVMVKVEKKEKKKQDAEMAKRKKEKRKVEKKKTEKKDTSRPPPVLAQNNSSPRNPGGTGSGNFPSVCLRWNDDEILRIARLHHYYFFLLPDSVIYDPLNEEEVMPAGDFFRAMITSESIHRWFHEKGYRGERIYILIPREDVYTAIREYAEMCSKKPEDFQEVYGSLSLTGVVIERGK
ncbi:hypothetical protein DRQ18_01600 [bacterium]|nr:MAG: hypothetical protein DRQ18_01600 [bacterium]